MRPTRDMLDWLRPRWAVLRLDGGAESSVPYPLCAACGRQVDHFSARDCRAAGVVHLVVSCHGRQQHQRVPREYMLAADAQLHAGMAFTAPSGPRPLLSDVAPYSTSTQHPLDR